MIMGGAAWIGLLGLFILRGQAIPWTSVRYNVPITLVFAGLTAHIAYSAVRLGPRRFGAAYWPIGLVWLAGAVLLYFRLVAKSADVSGHMAWSVLMGIQCVLQRLPLWFTAAAWAVVLQVIVLKFLVYGGYNGHKGLVAGLLLAGAAWIATRGRADVKYGVT
jgi:hypothetical protein